MGVKLHGVTCADGDVSLFFCEVPDLVGVDVTLKKGERAITARLSPAAWAELIERYSGPLSGIECKTEADEHGPEVVHFLKARVAELESSVRYYGDRVTEVAVQRDALKKLADDRAASFQQFQDLQLQARADRQAFLEARAALKVAEDRVAAMEAERAPSQAAPNGGRRRLELAEEPPTPATDRSLAERTRVQPDARD